MLKVSKDFDVQLLIFFYQKIVICRCYDNPFCNRYAKQDQICEKTNNENERIATDLLKYRVPSLFNSTTIFIAIAFVILNSHRLRHQIIRDNKNGIELVILYIKLYTIYLVYCFKDMTIMMMVMIFKFNLKNLMRCILASFKHFNIGYNHYINMSSTIRIRSRAMLTYV